MEQKKCCKSCGETYPLSCYHKQEKGYLGVRSTCKFCVSKYSFSYYQENQMEQLKRSMNWRENNPEKLEEYKKKAKHLREKERRERYYHNNQEKVNARSKLRYHIWKGYIEKKNHCEICGKHAANVEAHHHDYSKALEVIWVCKGCHEIIHARLSKQDYKEAS